MAAPTAVVVGMRALTKDLARMGEAGGPLLKAMAAAGKAAVEPIASVTRATLPQNTGRLAADVRTAGTRSGGSVRMGRSAVRYAGWVEFGGTRRVPFVSTRSYQPRGRYLFPAAVMGAPLAASLYEKAVTDAVHNYPWTNQGDSPHD